MLDIPDITVVVQYGITREVLTALQRGGRGGRSPTGEAIFMLMYEPWVKSIDLAAVEVDTVSDPDHPTVLKLTAHSTKQERSGIAMVKTIQFEHECLRQLYAAYLKDTTLDGTCPRCIGLDMLTLRESLALHFTARLCCNRHPGSDFDWYHFFRGRLLYQDPETSKLYYGAAEDPDREEILPPSPKKRKAGTKVRATNQRRPLISRLLAWRASMHSKDPLASVRPASFVLDDMDIKTLARLHPSNVTHPGQVVDALDQTQEWQDHWSIPIFQVIQAYDSELADHRKKERTNDHSSIQHGI